MKTIVAGSREGFGLMCVFKTLNSVDFKITEVVSGTCRGVDRLGERWASSYDIPIKQFPANWEKYGKSAGHIRNREMAEYADALIAFWDGKSPGTKNMIDTAGELGLEVKIVISGNFTTYGGT